LAAFRIWRLLAEDDIFDRPRRWALRVGNEWQKEGDPVPEGYRSGWATWLLCPWCSGLWISAALWFVWLAAEDWTTMFAVPFALSAVVALVRDNLDPPEA